MLALIVEGGATRVVFDIRRLSNNPCVALSLRSDFSCSTSLNIVFVSLGPEAMRSLARD